MSWSVFLQSTARQGSDFTYNSPNNANTWAAVEQWETCVRRRSTHTDTWMKGGENSMVLLFLSYNVFKSKGTRGEMYHKPVLNVILPAA